jgi:adenine-specific DNA-methyltransferase
MTQKPIYGDQTWKEPHNCMHERLAHLKELFPEIFTEGDKIDLDKVKEIFGESAENGPERYSFTWAGKRDAIRLLQVPSSATLVPAKEESVNFDTTENIFIEGDNLEVLKLLQKSYFGRIKMIYIDPPYNTGNDFIYPDNFADPLDYYLRLTGQKDSEGNLLTSNPESSGRFHSSWLSMMYPRLALARSLLEEDGFILCAIDDAEISNLRKLMDEVFGEENHIATLVYDKNRKNDAKLFSVGHEYTIVYVKNKLRLTEAQVVLRATKDGVDEVRLAFDDLRRQHNDNWELVRKGLFELYATWSDDDPRKPLARFTKVDIDGPYRNDRDISWPGGGGPRYEVLHPVTGKPCKIPSRGWVYPKKETMEKKIRQGLIIFGADENTIPSIRTNLFEKTTQVMRSVIFSYAQSSTQELLRLFDGDKVFDNPKNSSDIKSLINYLTSDNSIILDFFAGSCTTAQAVMDLNRTDKGIRRFIMVQLPEPCLEGSVARQAGFKSIADIGKERIHRVINKMKKGQQPLKKEDLGFRVFKLKESNFLSWSGIKQSDPAEYLNQLNLFRDPLKGNWTEERIIAEVAVKEGFGLNFRTERMKNIQSNLVYKVSDPDKSQSFLICLDQSIDMDGMKPLNLTEKDTLFVRDLALTDETAANLALQCRLKTI